jgi:hypothetical protein
MKTVLLALLLAGVIALGAVDVFISSGQPSTPPASAGSTDTTTPAAPSLDLAPPSTTSACWVPGDLIGEANPASIHCGS